MCNNLDYVSKSHAVLRMNSRATQLKFVCLRMSHCARYYSTISASQLHFLAKKNAKLAERNQ